MFRISFRQGHRQRKRSEEAIVAISAPFIVPADSYDRQLINNVHPPEWRNPEPAARYHLIVVGAGTAGLICAAGAAGLGARVALIERELMGGDCLNVGCVPSKALIRAARAYAGVRDAGEYGVIVPGSIRVEFAAVMQRMRRLRAALSAKDSAVRYRDLGVDVFVGEGRFSGPDSLQVEGTTLRFGRALIATGSRAVAPPIPGLREAGFLTNETVFGLTALPRRLVIIGAGSVGCELAQALRRFGAEVALLEAEPAILPREDRAAMEIVKRALTRDGIEIVEGCKILSVAANGAEKTLKFECNGAIRELVCDEILVGAGRAPIVEGLNLEAAGVEYDGRTGVKVDDYLRTSNPRIFAAGDVCSAYRFTHMADAMARIVIRNALFLGRRRASALIVPWCTYTDPEIAHVGLYENQAQERGIAVKTFMQPLDDVDRAVLDGETDGFVKVHVRAGSDQIVGATVVASHAGEMISELTLAMVGKLGVSTLADTIHPYPTQTEAIRKIGDAYNRSRLTPRVSWLLRQWLNWLT
jgi:pyruvate/2-oxoglutarate dehydrogenase complex dihydrolipoamide dehydrogenase (E3) component